MQENFFLSLFDIEINKSKEENDEQIPIRIEASAPTQDRDNDIIHLEAYKSEVIKGFLYDGVLDYDHQSILAKTPLERSQAIIGQPTEFLFEKSKKHEVEVPTIYGYLFKSNPYVQNSILPALKANSQVYGASLGGSIPDSGIKFEKSDSGQQVRHIYDISRLKHCAITPLQKAINQLTTIELAKSESFSEFVKALEAGSATDISQIQGGQALQTQSLEGAMARKIFPITVDMFSQLRRKKKNGETIDLPTTIFPLIKDLPSDGQKMFLSLLNEHKDRIWDLI